VSGKRECANERGRQPPLELFPPLQTRNPPSLFVNLFGEGAGGEVHSSHSLLTERGIEAERQRTRQIPLPKTEHMCYYHPEKGVRIMSLLQFAVKNQRWDLAAHTIVLAAVRVLNRGVKQDDRNLKTKKGRAKR
jgi:hypothetical protein